MWESKLIQSGSEFELQTLIFEPTSPDGKFFFLSNLSLSRHPPFFFFQHKIGHFFLLLLFLLPFQPLSSYFMLVPLGPFIRVGMGDTGTCKELPDFRLLPPTL